MRDITARQAGLSPEARRLYHRLLHWWLTRREWLWSRRDIHQRLRSGTRYRRVADLDAPIAELRKTGLIRPWSWHGLIERERGPMYALVQPRPRHGRQPGKIPAPHAAPPGEAAPPRRLSAEEEVAWRAASLLRQFLAAGRVFPTAARPDRPPVPGGCAICGEPLGTPGQPSCALCLRAIRKATADAHSRGR